jgi:hypothetical protein
MYDLFETKYYINQNKSAKSVEEAEEMFLNNEYETAMEICLDLLKIDY